MPGYGCVCIGADRSKMMVEKRLTLAVLAFRLRVLKLCPRRSTTRGLACNTQHIHSVDKEACKRQMIAYISPLRAIEGQF